MQLLAVGVVLVVLVLESSCSSHRVLIHFTTLLQQPAASGMHALFNYIGTEWI